MGATPEGQPAPADGLLPESAASNGSAAFGVYVHIPFCTVRCGYCDFNTYTHTDMPGVSQAEYSTIASEEVNFAQRVLNESGISSREVSTIFLAAAPPPCCPQSIWVESSTALRRRGVLRRAPKSRSKRTPTR